MMNRLILLTFLLLASSGVFAQVVSKNVQKADRAFEDNNYKKALEIYLKAVSEEVVTAYLARQVGNCYRLQGDLAQAEIWYENALKQPDHSSLDFILLSYVQKANGKEQLSAESLNKLYVLELLPELNASTSVASTFLARFRSGLLNLQIAPVNINSPEAEFSPIICRDALVWATSRFDRDLARIKQIDPQQHLNIYSARLSSSGELGTPFVFSNDLLSSYFTGPIAFSPSGDTAYFVRQKFLSARRGSEKQMSDNNLKIHRAIYNRGKWIDQGPVSFCSDNFSVGDPAVSPDGKKLYYASDDPGGFGGADIFVREIHTDGSFGEASNLGSKVNTPRNEMTPFMSKDGTLFFASDGQPGLGFLDLFIAFQIPSGFDYVSNLGYPINSPFDDFGAVLTPTGNLAFFSSNRPDGAGDNDIYAINIEKLTITHTVDGLVSDDNGTPLNRTIVNVLEGTTILYTLSTDASGKFSFKLDDSREVKVQLEHPDFFSANSIVSSFGFGLEPTQIPIKITMIRDAGYTLSGIILSSIDESLIAGAQVMALPPDSTQSLVGTTDQFGRFSFKLVMETDYRINLSKPGYASKWFTLSTRNRERGVINLSMLYETKLTPDIKPGITGIVSDAKSALPLSNAIVTLSSPLLPQSLTLATNISGMFMQTNLTEGDYTVKIEKDGYKPLNISIVVGKQPVNLNSTNNLVLEPLANSFVAVGLVSNKDDNAPLSEVNVTLLNKTTNDKVQGKTDEFGSFDFKVEPDRIYILKLEKDKFFAKTLMVTTQGIPAGMLNLNTTYDLKMEAIVMNKAIEIPNIYYDLGKFTIKPEAAQELDKVVKLLSENPTIQIELSSHTDSRGGSEQNQQLSQKRAESAVKYIASKGIAKTRIVAKP